jgi:hypothetical protein
MTRADITLEESACDRLLPSPWPHRADPRGPHVCAEQPKAHARQSEGQSRETPRRRGFLTFWGAEDTDRRVSARERRGKAGLPDWSLGVPACPRSRQDFPNGCFAAGPCGELSSQWNANSWAQPGTTGRTIGSSAKEVAPGGVEPPHADSKSERQATRLQGRRLARAACATVRAIVWRAPSEETVKGPLQWSLRRSGTYADGVLFYGIVSAQTEKVAPRPRRSSSSSLSAGQPRR